MSRKWLYFLALPAFLLIGGYLALQVFLRTGNPAASESRQEQLVTTQSSAAQTNKAAGNKTDDAGAKQKKSPDKKTGSAKATQTAVSNEEADKKASPLDLSALFIDKLQQLVRKSSNGLYNLSVGDLDIDVLASTVSLHEVKLRPDEQAVERLKTAGVLPQSVVALSFEDLLIKGINIDDAINSKNMDYKLIKLVNPVVEIDRYQAGSEKSSSGDFSQAFLQQMEKLAIEKLEVEGGTITVHDKVKGESKKLQQVQVLMQDILLTEATRKEKDRFLFAKAAQLAFRDFEMEMQGGLYKFGIGEAFVDATQRKLELKNISYRSPLSKEAFVAKQETAAEKYDIHLPLVNITGVDWWPAFNGEEISAGEVKTNGGKLSVYLDRTLPPIKKLGNFPNQMLKKLSINVDVEKLSMQDLELAYEEFNPNSEQSGTLYVDDMTLVVNNITNKENNQAPVTADVSGLLMKQVPLQAAFSFDMEKASEGVFSATLKVDSFQAAVINPTAKPLGLMKADRGNVHAIEARMQGNEMAASGEVLLLYEKLKLSLMKKDKDGEELKKRHLLSFLANVFVIKNRNPAWLTGKTRKKEAYFERDPEAGFMNLVWKTAFVGLLKTLGAPEKIAKKK